MASISSVDTKFNSFITHLLGNRYGIQGFIQRYSSTIAAVALIAPVIFNGISFFMSHKNEIRPKLFELKFHILKQITPPVNLEKKQILDWYLKKGVKLAGIVLLISAGIIGTYALIKFGIITTVAAQVLGLLNKLSIVRLFFDAMTTSTPSIVYPGYVAIALAHLYQAKRCYQNNEKRMMIKNIFAAAISLITIGFMAAGIYDARWHHMSYGLLAMIPSNSTLNTFGGLMVADSMLYWIRPFKDNFDFSNIFTNHLTLFIVQLSCMTIFELIKRKHFQSTPRPEIT